MLHVASCEHSNEPLGSIKCGEFLEWVVFLDYQLLKEDSAPRSKLANNGLMKRDCDIWMNPLVIKTIVIKY
jgi:hypothetical protein